MSLRLRIVGGRVTRCKKVTRPRSSSHIGSMQSPNKPMTAMLAWLNARICDLLAVALDKASGWISQSNFFRYHEKISRTGAGDGSGRTQLLRFASGGVQT